MNADDVTLVDSTKTRGNHDDMEMHLPSAKIQKDGGARTAAEGRTCSPQGISDITVASDALVEQITNTNQSTSSTQEPKSRPLVTSYTGNQSENNQQNNQSKSSTQHNIQLARAQLVELCTRTKPNLCTRRGQMTLA